MYDLVQRLNVNYQEIKLMKLKNDNLISYLEIGMNNYDVTQINRMDNIYVQYYNNQILVICFSKNNNFFCIL